MVLLAPDDLPPGGANTLAANVDEMRERFRDWDPRISKMLAHCKSVHKWRLCIRPSLNPSWSHPSAAFTVLGDAAHATLPYLASGAGMGLEDAHVLGLCLSRVRGKSKGEKERALRVYERCRRGRTERVVRRSSLQQTWNHLSDGELQRHRDHLYAAFGAFEGRGRVTQEQFAEMGLQPETDPLPWRWGGVAGWLLTYDCEADVERKFIELAEMDRRESSSLGRSHL